MRVEFFIASFADEKSDRSASEEGSTMDIQVLDRNVGITAGQREHIDRCLQFAFDQFSSHLRSINVLLSDVNGPKGGEDVQCRLKIVLNGKGELVVEGMGVSVEAVVSETADRASSAVSRRLDRLRDQQGTSMSGQ
jgi:putative sigma-54 modulation protein